jgi:tetratricopeptide (TPR) repeat protein
MRLKDRRQLATTAQNVGILYQNRAQRTEDPAEREAWLRRAVESVKESLAIWLQDENQVYAAASYFQLGILHRMLGELDEAERNAHEALAIRERLNLPDVYKDYGNLAEIARARGDEAAAAEWQAKCDAKWEELEGLRRGDGQGAKADEELGKFVLALAQAAFQARAGGALAPEAAEALAQMAGAPEPFPTLGSFLQKIADRAPLPPVPTGLPAELGKIVEALAQAIHQNDPAR